MRQNRSIFKTFRGNCINYVSDNPLYTYDDLIRDYHRILYDYTPSKVYTYIKDRERNPLYPTLCLLELLNCAYHNDLALINFINALVKYLPLNRDQARQLVSIHLKYDLKEKLSYQYDHILFDTTYRNSLTEILRNIYTHYATRYYGIEHGMPDGEAYNSIVLSTYSLHLMAPDEHKIITEEVRHIIEHNEGDNIINEFYKDTLTPLIDKVMGMNAIPTNNITNTALKIWKEQNKLYVINYDKETEKYCNARVFYADKFEFNDVIDYVEADVPVNPKTIRLIVSERGYEAIKEGKHKTLAEFFALDYQREAEYA